MCDEIKINGKFTDTIKKLKIHNHVCSIYKTKEEQFSVIVPFIKIGLERGEKCIYVVNDNTAHEVQVAMQTGGIDTDSALKSGSLSILNRQEYFLKEGSFGPDWMIQFLKETTYSAKSEGFNALRLAAEMTWFSGVDQGIERLVEFESKINSFFSENDIVAICQYNRMHFSPEIILNTIRTHPIVICGSLVCKNFYYVPPEEFLKPKQTSLEIDRLLDNIRTREQNEFELRESEERYRDLFENVNDLIQCVTPDGRLIYVNSAWREKLGYGEEEIDKLTLFDIIHPDSHTHCMEVFKRVISGERVNNIEAIFVAKDGRKIVVEGSANCRFNEGKPVFTRGIFRDITERKKMEEALLQSEKLKSIGTITAGISHEFNNILNIISGNVQLLQMDYKDHSELMDSLRIIKKSVGDGAEISNRMLEFAQAKKDTTVSMSFDINKLIKQAIDFTIPRWKNMAQVRGIDYHMDTEGMKDISSILCNPIEIKEVFTNIINNALDAMPDGGRLSFRTWSKDDTVFVSITDNGKGMTEDVKKNIFDPFFTTRRPEGTGLGMSTSYSIVVRHSGKIEVESEVNKGTIFTLSFPITIETVLRTESTEPTREKEAKGLRILVVDDEKDICNILDKFFSKKGHLVRTVDNGTEAIILSKVADYDLVLCDLAMPEVFGYDVIKTLNKLEKRPKIGIITGWGEKLKPMDDEDLKVDFIIKKPFDFSEVERYINEEFRMVE